VLALDGKPLAWSRGPGLAMVWLDPALPVTVQPRRSRRTGQIGSLTQRAGIVIVGCVNAIRTFDR
jgi:hypothetical protein